MKLSIQYIPEGLLFQLSCQGQPDTFPLNHLTAKTPDTSTSWEQLILAEQLWYDGQLTFSPEHNHYILPAALCVQLDAETKKGLRLPAENMQLSVFEKGNLGSPHYEIKWAPLVGGKPFGRFQRKGVVVQYGSYLSMLTAPQFCLVNAIDEYRDPGSVEGRAKYHSQISHLAENAHASLDHFMQRREFFFEENVDYSLTSDNPKEIRIRPELPNLPENIRTLLPSKLNGPLRYREQGRQKTVFTSDNVRKEYNAFGALPPITDQAVPDFVENPLAYLPEEISFDAELFSQRVKGLKIRCFSAIPYVHTVPDPDKPGWFQIDTGFSLCSEREDITAPSDTNPEELRQLITSAADHGDKYVFYEEQWIKVDPENVCKFQKAEQEVSEKYGHSIPQIQAHYILDIYDNLDRVEYDEALLAYKSLNPKTICQYEVPSCFAGQLKPYQVDGYGFLRSHYETNTGVLLADDMGLGKTVQIIAFLSYLFSQNQLATALLVMPKSLLENWLTELHKFMPAERKIYIHQGATRYRTKEAITQYDVVLTTYDTLARDQTMLAQIVWTCVICDEVQRIKNFQTLAASAVKGMNTKCRIAMTGTPVENRLGELWSIADFAQPGLLGSYHSFRQKYEIPLGESHGNNTNLAASLIQTLSPIFLRRTKDILGNQLPEKSEQTLLLNMDRGTSGLYRSIIEELNTSHEQSMVLSVIQRLLMLCSHPRLITHESEYEWDADALIRESPKLQWTVQKLSEIIAKGEKAIIFTKFIRMQSMLKFVVLEKFGLDAKIINGEVAGNRLEIIQQFSAQPGAGVIILSPRAAGVGLTITAANHVIHYTREWNPAVENQATDRCYRIGQTKSVQVYYPILHANSFISADERLDQLLCAKRELMKNVIIPADLNIKIEEFESVLSNYPAKGRT